MQKFTKQNRLRKLSDFNNLRTGSQKFRDPFLSIYFKSNEFPTARIGISISGKYFNSVKRNRIKRNLREIFRKNISTIRAIDFLVVAQNDKKNDFDLYIKNLACSFRTFLLKVSLDK